MATWLRITVSLGLTPLLLTTGFTAASFPPAMEEFISRAAPLTAADRQTLFSGAPISKLLDDAEPTKEVAVFGAVWMAAPLADYVRWIKDIEHFEKGAAFRVT